MVDGLPGLAGADRRAAEPGATAVVPGRGCSGAGGLQGPAHRRRAGAADLRRGVRRLRVRLRGGDLRRLRPGDGDAADHRVLPADQQEEREVDDRRRDHDHRPGAQQPRRQHAAGAGADQADRGECVHSGGRDGACGRRAAADPEADRAPEDDPALGDRGRAEGSRGRQRHRRRHQGGLRAGRGAVALRQKTRKRGRC